MNSMIKLIELLPLSSCNFKLPSYDEITDVGLYLEQTVTYVNECLKPFGFFAVTSSMVRNYVKMGLIDNPIKKQYHREHIAKIIAITFLKSVMSLENIKKIYELQSKTYSYETAYNYFKAELINLLEYKFGESDEIKHLGNTHSLLKDMLKNALTAVSDIIYLQACFALISEDEAPEKLIGIINKD